VLRIPIRFLSGASRLAIKRLQRTAVPASKLACPSAADPQHDIEKMSIKGGDICKMHGTQGVY
jgi:hypothetical protein